jgi:hypothetical protein
MRSRNSIAWSAWLQATLTRVWLVLGGKIEPLWLEARPGWFPDEFGWVVGCTFRGMPVEETPVRNVIGANMSVRRDVLVAAGGFRHSYSRPIG